MLTLKKEIWSKFQVWRWIGIHGQSFEIEKWGLGWAEWADKALATKPGCPSSFPRTHMVKRENIRTELVLWPLYMSMSYTPIHACACAYTHEHTQVINDSKCVLKEKTLHVRVTMLEIFSIFTYSSLVFIRIISLRKPSCGFWLKRTSWSQRFYFQSFLLIIILLIWWRNRQNHSCDCVPNRTALAWGSLEGDWSL